MLDIKNAIMIEEKAVYCSDCKILVMSGYCLCDKEPDLSKRIVGTLVFFKDQGGR